MYMQTLKNKSFYASVGARKSTRTISPSMKPIHGLQIRCSPIALYLFTSFLYSSKASDLSIPNGGENQSTPRSMSIYYH